MTDTYRVYLYYDTMNQTQIRAFSSDVTSEEYCKMLYFQLRPMGAKGEIRVIHEGTQVGFISLYDSTCRYVRTDR